MRVSRRQGVSIGVLLVSIAIGSVAQADDSASGAPAASPRRAGRSGEARLGFEAKGDLGPEAKDSGGGGEHLPTNESGGGGGSKGPPASDTLYRRLCESLVPGTYQSIEQCLSEERKH